MAASFGYNQIRHTKVENNGIEEFKIDTSLAGYIMPGEDEKKLRTSAKRKFSRVYNRFREAIENDTEIDIVTAKYAEI